jgi:hypothetical protein
MPGDRNPAATRDAAASAVRFDAGPRRSETLHADLVVEASGRGALTIALLDALGWDRPEVTEIGIDISYATVVVPIPHDAPLEWKLPLTLPDPPALARYAALVSVEGNRWMVTIADYGATSRLESWPAFLERLRGLHTPTLYNALRHAERPEGIRRGSALSRGRRRSGRPSRHDGCRPTSAAQ